MWPWGHAAAGYLLYTLYLRAKDRRHPTGACAIALGVGTQVPDLIDKPLAWPVSVLPTGRSLGHSLVLALLVLAVLRVVHESPVSLAFAIGYLSHLATDALYPFVSGDVAALTFLLWPILPSPESETAQSLLAHLRAIEASPLFVGELLLAAVALAVWTSHGRPGLDTLRRTVGRRIAALRS